MSCSASCCQACTLLRMFPEAGVRASIRASSVRASVAGRLLRSTRIQSMPADAASNAMALPITPPPVMRSSVSGARDVPEPPPAGEHPIPVFSGALTLPNPLKSGMCFAGGVRRPVARLMNSFFMPGSVSSASIMLPRNADFNGLAAPDVLCTRSVKRTTWRWSASLNVVYAARTSGSPASPPFPSTGRSNPASAATSRRARLSPWAPLG